VLVIFPYATQLGPDPAPALTTALVDLARTLGWPAIDLVPAFTKASRSGVALFTDLWHPTAAGYALAADVIATELMRSGVMNDN
jgi:hypothetical protein